MSDESPPATSAGAPRRKAAVAKKHTVGRVILISSIVLAMTTGLGVVYLVRHLNGNIDKVPTDALSNRPDKVYTGNGDPLNILVMGDDTRAGEGNKIDGESGGGGSDTTILVHLSADRTRAYAVSIPRDSIVDRPASEACKSEDPVADAMWNSAYTAGGPLCTVAQVESTTDIFVDHFVVIDFNGFGEMVDAVGGVPVCVPEDIKDPAHAIFVPAGDPSVLSGDEALDYVRARYVGELAQQNDISRIKRQQTFIGALVREVKSAGTLTRLDKVVNFLDAATNSITTDDELGSVTRIGKIAMQLQGVGLENVKFVTLPTEYFSADSEFRGKVSWTEDADKIWGLLNEDKVLPRNLLNGSLSAEPPASSAEAQKPSEPASSGTSTPDSPESPAASETTEPPSEEASPSETPTPEKAAEPEEQIPGVCS